MMTSLGAKRYVSGLAKCYARKVKDRFLKTHECFSEKTGLYEVNQVI